MRWLIRLPVIYPLLAFVRARRFVVRGESMLPAILPGERVLVDTLAYRWSAPQRGEVVLLRHRERPGLVMAKRIAGVPGEAIDGRTLAEDEYWVLGDRPEFSTDSRELGPVQGSDLIGRAWWVYWPAGAVRRITTDGSG
jgi:signal peptidase I